MVKQNDTTQSSTADREILSTRLLNAPRELVFRVWTDPKHIDKWWGPTGFRNATEEMNVKVGGTWRFMMHGPDGTDYPNRIVYTEVVKPERLVFNHGSDIDNDPNQFHVTVTFEEQGDKTLLTMRMVFKTAAERDMVVKEYGALEGQKQTLGRLEEYLADQLNEAPAEGMAQLTITRIFDAPRELVYQAFTQAEHLAHWWGPKGFTIRTKELDLRPGGMFLYSMGSPDGTLMWGKFIYRTVIEPQRIDFVNSFSDENGGTTRNPWSATWPLEILNILTLEEQEGKTLLTIKGWPINADEDGLKAFAEGIQGMQGGFKGTFDQLDEYLAKIK